MTPRDKCELILDWASSVDDFNTDFVEDVRRFIFQAGYATDAQERALDNIIESFRILEDGE